MNSYETNIRVSKFCQLFEAIYAGRNRRVVDYNFGVCVAKCQLRNLSTTIRSNYVLHIHVLASWLGGKTRSSSDRLLVRRYGINCIIEERVQVDIG
jgi:hypothetical protein